MKIAIPTDGKKGLEDTIAEHFGRAGNFLVYDTETKIFDIYPNPEISGKAELPPDFLHRQGVEAIIVFSLGLMAYNKFKNYNIKMYKAIEGTVTENIQKLKDNELKELKEKDIDVF